MPEDSNECYVCTGTEPPLWRSACLCTDRFLHEKCLKKLLESRLDEATTPRCSVCASPFRNVHHVVVSQCDFFSKSHGLWLLVFTSITMSACAINTGVNAFYGRERNSKKLKLILVVFAGFFLILSLWMAIFWIVYLYQNGTAALYNTCYKKTGRYVITKPEQCGVELLGIVSSAM